MIATKNPPVRTRLVEFLRRRGRWLTGAALLALVPKCLLCLAAYAGLGAALGLAGPELCGAVADSPSRWPEMLAVAGAALAMIQLATASRCHAQARLTCSTQPFPSMRSGKV